MQLLRICGWLLDEEWRTACEPQADMADRQKDRNTEGGSRPTNKEVISYDADCKGLWYGTYPNSIWSCFGVFSVFSVVAASLRDWMKIVLAFVLQESAHAALRSQYWIVESCWISDSNVEDASTKFSSSQGEGRALTQESGRDLVVATVRWHSDTFGSFGICKMEDVYRWWCKMMMDVLLEVFDT